MNCKNCGHEIAKCGVCEATGNRNQYHHWDKNLKRYCHECQYCGCVNPEPEKEAKKYRMGFEANTEKQKEAKKE